MELNLKFLKLKMKKYNNYKNHDSYAIWLKPNGERIKKRTNFNYYKVGQKNRYNWLIVEIFYFYNNNFYSVYDVFEFSFVCFQSEKERKPLSLLLVLLFFKNELLKFLTYLKNNKNYQDIENLIIILLLILLLLGAY